jgi:Tfp pilus assembly protein PilE
MPAKITYPKHRIGMTIVEMMITILVLAFIVIGTAGYRYYSALDAKKAEKEAAAAKIALLLNEGWRGLQGDVSSTTADTTVPSWGSSSDITITKINSGAPDAPSDCTVLGYYKIVSNRVNYYATMSYKLPATRPCLMILNITVAWPIRITETANYSTANYWPFTLTPYVQLRSY